MGLLFSLHIILLLYFILQHVQCGMVNNLDMWSGLRCGSAVSPFILQFSPYSYFCAFLSITSTSSAYVLCTA